MTVTGGVNCRLRYLSRSGSGGCSSKRVGVATSLFAVLDDVARVRLELRLLDVVEFTVATILLQLLVATLTLLLTPLVLTHHPTTT